jgi:zinc/manganese transport system substrate-binding protein
MQIRTQRIPAVFLENVVDPRLVDAIARDTGVRIGGTLYSDALTPAGGVAPTYIDLMRHNARTLAAALGS